MRTRARCGIFIRRLQPETATAVATMIWQISHPPWAISSPYRA